jgi:molybdopterin-guanine dinucleotide biosynthesis protein A
MCTAAILAGGHGRRMGGQPKTLLQIGPTRIIDRQLAVAHAVTSRVAIVANDRELYTGLGVPIWTDLQPGTGPLGGIYTALTHATTAVTLIIAGDMPFLTAEFLRYLVESGRDVDLAIPCTPKGCQPLCAAYNQTCINTIQRHLDADILKVADLLPAVRVRKLEPNDTAPFNPNGTLFFNINTPRDYATALNMERRQAI